MPPPTTTSPPLRVLAIPSPPLPSATPPLTTTSPPLPSSTPTTAPSSTAQQQHPTAPPPFSLLVSPISMEKATWDAHYLRFFCDICMEEVNANNRDGGCLSRKGYKNLEDKFAEKTGKRLTKKQFKNKWDSLKKEYTGWMELLNATGLGWDPETKTMDADNDWWQTHLQYRPEHVKFRYGPPANLTQLDVMFSKAHVTGESSAIPGEEETERTRKLQFQWMMTMMPPKKHQTS
ncbi:hypothetical protein ACQ4PT_046250 [Festuca glaucescens]